MAKTQKKVKEKKIEELDMNHQSHFKLKMDIGISENDRKKLVKNISVLLADSYSLLIKLHNYHWNVRGPHFRQIHLMTEEQYTELFTAIDELAERIRSLGFRAPGSMKEFLELSDVSEPNSSYSSNEMLADLLKSNETITRRCRELIETAEKAGDSGTADLVTVRLEVHEKSAWMLRSSLEE